MYYHNLSEESLETRHSCCPVGPESWCKFQLDKVNGINLYHQMNCLPFSHRSEFKNIFARLFSDTHIVTLQIRNGTESERVTQQHCMGTVSKASFPWYT